MNDDDLEHMFKIMVEELVGEDDVDLEPYLWPEDDDYNEFYDC